MAQGTVGQVLEADFRTVVEPLGLTLQYSPAAVYAGDEEQGRE